MKKTYKNKFSFLDRREYHGNKFKEYIDAHLTKDNGARDLEKWDKEDRKNSSFTYSEGYMTGADDIRRGYSASNFNGYSDTYKKGYKKAQADFDKALKKKF